MPYIPYRRRDKINHRGDNAYNAGELNYIITNEVNDYLTSKGLSYKTINDIVGALEGAKLEFYRRIAVPYEDKKLEDNGDVYLLTEPIVHAIPDGEVMTDEDWAKVMSEEEEYNVGPDLGGC